MILSRLERAGAFLNHPRARAHATWLAPLLFGLVAVLLGQDDNWDMRNYHLYNAYALFNGRIGFDLAPAGFQSYFNPTLELPYYLLNRWLAPWAAGLVMGALHGLSFMLVAAIARLLLPAASQRLVLLVAAAGVLGPGFLSELGNTMGDNLTALFVLAALYLLLRHWDRLLRWDAGAPPALLCAGLAAGMGAGLKLTNLTYAIALCAALLAAPSPWWQRVRLALGFGIGVLGGIAITAGWWLLKMWQAYANPLFPQFNNIFHSPLATENGVIDFYFRPHGWMENILWPFIFTLHTRRVSELPMKLAVWPALYLLLAAFAVLWLRRRLRLGGAGGASALAPRNAFLLLFFVIAYVVWMRMFSIYRYLVPLELLAPLLIWILAQSMQATLPAAPRLAGWLLAVLALGVFPVANWGHASWDRQVASADVPPFATPSRSIVFFAQPDPPSGWMAGFFPPQVRVIALDTGFPGSPAWQQGLRDAIAQRSGPHYVLLAAARNDKDSTRLHKLAVAQMLGWTDDAAGCGKLDSLLSHVRLQVELRRLPSGGCTFDLPPQQRIDLAAVDRDNVRQMADKMARFGLRLDPGSCTRYRAVIGKEPHPYQLCRVATSE